MKNLVRAAAIFSGVVSLSGVAAALAVGCSGDDTVIGYGNDSGPDVVDHTDSSLDSSSDTSPPADAGPDSSFHFDAGPPNIAQFNQQINQTGCARVASCCGVANFDLNACLSDV
ncbi:MAG: hypothetical protein ABI461_05390, partial [Polyangiaceae bacterium]